MPYTILDLLEKLVLIEKNGYDMFIKISNAETVEAKAKTIAKIFAKEELRHIELYKGLIKEIDNKETEQLDFSVYDKASKLVSEFSKIFHKSNFNDVKEMLEFCLDFEKENLALLLSIKGLLINMDKDTESKSYKVFSQIINEELKHVENVNYFIK